MRRNAGLLGASKEVRILPPRQKESLVNIQFAGLSNLTHSPCVSASVGSKVYFKPTVAMPLPYKLPRLIIPKAKSKDQRWIIKYYVWNADVGKMVMQRDMSCNQIKNLVDRKKFAAVQMKDITALLKTGHHLDSKKKAALDIDKLRQEQGDFMKFSDAMNLAIIYKRAQKLKSIRNYELIYKKLETWFKTNSNIKNLPVKLITRNHIEDFLQSLSTPEKQLSGRSYNNNLSLLQHLFKVLIDKEYIEKNPCAKIESRRQTLGRNIAYTTEQQIELIDFMREKYPALLAFCQTMYYTLMRTNEITHMQAWWIGAYDSNKIYLPKEHSKNGQERHIVIPPQLERVIQDMNWRSLEPSTYIFSSGFRPGKNLVQSKMHGNKYRRWVLEKLKYPKDYTMYSWKHTGVVFLYRNNIPRSSIRMQAGFMDDKSFETYLKSLGLFENELLITNYPSLPV